MNLWRYKVRFICEYKVFGRVIVTVTIDTKLESAL